MDSVQPRSDRHNLAICHSAFKVGTHLGLAASIALWGSGALAQAIVPFRVDPQQSVLLAQASPSTAAANLLFVSPTVGNDTSGNGSQGSPFRTITQALRVAPPNTAIMLAAGTYSEETGETFPLNLKPGVTIQGDPSSRGRGIVIRGGGAFLSPTSASQNITILGANQAGLTGVTVTNPNPRGYGLWIESSSPSVVSNTFSGSNHDGISITGSGSPLVQGNYFTQNGANGMTIYGTSQAEVRENLFERTGFGININQNAAPRLIGNRITQNQDGIVIQASAHPILRGNTIEGNTRDGLVAIAQAQPDLGTAVEPGNNVFRSNGRQDINATATSQILSAIGNQMAGATTGRLDLGDGSASVAIAPPVTVPPATAPSVTNPSVSPPASATAIGRPTSLPSVAIAPPTALPPQSSRPVPTTPAVDNGGFGTLPQLAPAPAVAVPPATNPVPLSNPSTDPSSTATPQLNVATQPIAPDAIEIPVQLAPETASSPTAPIREVVIDRATPGRSTAPVALESGEAIEIPVPPPDSRQAALPSTARDVPTAPRSLSPVPNANLLPVPGGDIPLGNIGDMPTVLVSRDPLQRTPTLAAGGGSRAVALGLRYRVLVEAGSESEQEQVRSIVPGAFRTYANGQTMMQVGAYSDRANADETAQMLNSNGFRASVQSIE